MVNDHSDSERGDPLPSHRLFFPISSKGFSGVTDFFLGGGGGGRKGGPDVRLGEPRGRHLNDFFPITFIVTNQK